MKARYTRVSRPLYAWCSISPKTGSVPSAVVLHSDLSSTSCQRTISFGPYPTEAARVNFIYIVGLNLYLLDISRVKFVLYFIVFRNSTDIIDRVFRISLDGSKIECIKFYTCIVIKSGRKISQIQFREVFIDTAISISKYRCVILMSLFITFLPKYIRIQL